MELYKIMFIVCSSFIVGGLAFYGNLALLSLTEVIPEISPTFRALFPIAIIGAAVSGFIWWRNK